MLLGVLMTLSFGCATPRRFDLGLYDVPAAYFPMVSKAGFNLVTQRATLDSLNQARENDLRVLNVLPDSGPLSRDSMNRLDRHPALWGWYLPDEPDLHSISPEQIAATSREIKRREARKQQVLVLMSWRNLGDYLGLGDILMMDCYPVAWQPISALSENFARAKLSAGKRKFYAALQAFDWKAFPDQAPDLTKTREPTEAELRCMTYLALARGAEGMFYFSFRPGPWFLPEHEVWTSLRKVVQEVRDREALFTAQPQWFRQTIDYPDGPATVRNESGESRILSKVLRVKKARGQFAAGDYLLAINTTDKPTSIRLTLPDYDMGAVKELGSAQPLPAQENWVDKMFEPYGVGIFALNPLPQAKPSSTPPSKGAGPGR